MNSNSLSTPSSRTKSISKLFLFRFYLLKGEMFLGYIDDWRDSQIAGVSSSKISSASAPRVRSS